MKVKISELNGRMALLENLEGGKDIHIPTSLLPHNHRVGMEFEMERKGKVFEYQLLNPEDFSSKKDKRAGLKKK